MPSRSIVLVFGLLVVSCSSKPSSPPTKAEVELNLSQEPTFPEFRSLFEIAGPECTGLVKKLLALAEAAGERVDTSWENAVQVQLATCKAADFSAEETRCMKTSSSVDEYENCTAARQETRKLAERGTRNPQGIQWIDNIDVGLELSSKQGKPTIVHFIADWCIPCVQFEKNVFGEEAVAKAVEGRFTTIRLDVTHGTDADAAVQKRFKAETLPALLILDAAGKEIHRFQAITMPTVEEFVKRLSSVN